MKRWLLLAVFIAAVLFGIVVPMYNSMVKANEGVAGAWANVQTQYQRRSDLIPNLVNTVKGYASHERETLDEVVAARAAATGITVNADGMTKEQFDEYTAAQQNVKTSLGKLIAIAENYPDLKANQNFLELQSQLEGTENRISVARNEYNAVVREYNVMVSTFPRNIIASLFSFSKKEFFASEAGAESAPKVEF